MAKKSPPSAQRPEKVILLRLAVSFKPDDAAALAEEPALAGMSRTALVRRIVQGWLREKRRQVAAAEVAGPRPDRL